MLGKLAELILFGFAPMMLGAIFMPGAVAAEEIALTGEVAYRERIALPPNAVLTVRLTDVSLADAPGAVVAEQKIEPAGQVPIKFELRYDPAVVQPKMNYALQARITVDDKLWFTTDQRYAVDPLKPEPAKLLLKMVRQDAAAPSLVRQDLDRRGYRRQGRHRQRAVDPQRRVGRQGDRQRWLQPLFRAGRSGGRHDQDRQGRRDHDGVPRGADGPGTEILRRAGEGRRLPDRRSGQAVPRRRQRGRHRAVCRAASCLGT